MREILFRGKRIDNGEWIEGSLSTEYYQNHGVVLICPSEDEAYKVDPSTVGQYTGLTDKNGKKIFEGDIFIDPDFADDNIRCFVRFSDDDCAFIAKNASNSDEYFLRDYSVFGKMEIKVIGNIHNNPELLEEQS